MERITNRWRAGHHRLALCAALLLFIGCSQDLESKQQFLSLIREHCTRDESRVNPKPLRKSKLERLASRPEECDQVDETTQRWIYRFPDGQVDLHVLLETGNRWQDEDPMVFVDLKRTAMR